MSNNTATTTPAAPEIKHEPGEPIHLIPVDLFDRHPLNRKVVPTELDELCESIRVHGQLTPALARPIDKGGRFQLLAGECRLHACRKVGLSTLKVIVRNYNDQQAAEILLIDNLQRTDLTPLQEAEGYQNLLELRDEKKQPLYTVEKIAERINRDPTHIYKALRWVRLPELARLAFERGVIGKELATIIARIPDELDRRRATLSFIWPAGTYPDYEDSPPDGDEVTALEVEMKKLLLEPEPRVAVRAVVEAREFTRENFMASLSGVSFDLKDEKLCPKAGGCMTCEFRTGSSPIFKNELIQGKATGGGTSGLDPMVCTRPSCLAEKHRADFERKAEEAKKRGIKVLSPDDSAKEFGAGGGHLRHNSEYIELDEKPGYDLVGHVDDKKVQPWKKLLEGSDVPLVLAQDGRGKTRTLVPRAVAVTAVNERDGVKSPFAKASKQSERPEALRDKTATRTIGQEMQHERKLERLGTIKALLMLRDRAVKGLNLADLRFMLDVALENSRMEAVRLLCDVYEVKPTDPKGKESLSQGNYADALKTAFKNASHNEILSVVFLALIAQEAGWEFTKSEPLELACDHFKVDLKACEKIAAQELKAKNQPAPKKPAMKTRSESVRRNEKGIAAGERAKFTAKPKAAKKKAAPKKAK